MINEQVTPNQFSILDLLVIRSSVVNLVIIDQAVLVNAPEPINERL